MDALHSLLRKGNNTSRYGGGGQNEGVYDDQKTLVFPGLTNEGRLDERSRIG